MLLAKVKEDQNIVEYILYMWQMEDLIRGSNMNLEKILNSVFPGSGENDQREEYAIWFTGLIDEMKREGIEKSGHVKSVRTYMKSIDSLHHTLLTVYQEQEYIELYNDTSSHIESLRARISSKDIPATEVSLIGLYGFLILKLSGKEISQETIESMKQIGKLMAYLADSFNKLKRGELKLPVRLSN